MVHNGIEYGLMQVYAEGFDILRNKDSKDLPVDERFALNMPDIAKVRRRGSVISSWLLDLGAAALAKYSQLKDFSSAPGFRRGTLDHRSGGRGGSPGGNAAGAKDIHAVDGKIGQVEDFLADDAG
jgi:6-phosphogluconate dehydrogenase